MKVSNLKTILLKFSGPLQSWGTDSNFETRRTDFYPSKSAVIGVIAAGLGLKRDDEKIQKLNDLDFAIRIDQYGNLLRDYHTAKKFDSKGKFERTYVTNRYYLEDYIFIVGISHRDNKFIEEIEKSLKNQYFQIYMGRRSNPIPMDFILDVSDNNLMELIRKYEWQAAQWYKRKYEGKKVTLEIFADEDLTDNKSNILRKDRVISFSQKDRKFGFRYESREKIVFEHKRTEESDNSQKMSDHESSENIEHDIMAELGD